MMSLAILFAICVMLGLMCGIFNALLGFGGGFFIVPAVYWLLHFVPDVPPSLYMKYAIGSSLLIMIVNSAHSTYRFDRAQRIDWILAKPYIIPMTVGALLTYFIAYSLSGDLIRWLFVAYLLLTIILNLKKSFFDVNHPQNKRIFSMAWKRIFSILVGFSASLLGVGGSVFTVPHFRKQGMRIEHAVPIATMLTLPLSIMGSVAYFFAAYHANLIEPVRYAIGYLYLPAVVGILVGSHLTIPLAIKMAPKINDYAYSIAYMAALIVVALLMII